VILAKAKERGVIINQVSREKLDEMSQTGKHQGVVALCPPHEYAAVSDILRISKQNGTDPFLVILDKIIDPHNFGAIIRTASACGADGIIIPKRRSVGITAAVVRASAGAAGHMPVARVANIVQTMESLKQQGVWMAGADMDGKPIYGAPLTGPIALVVGSEGEGLSRLVKERCDFLVSLPMAGPMASLNASVAAGVALYEIVRQRGLIARTN
jgi:23S rRNA (guanosine2251-2'-O)-methyltransferase